MKKGSSLSRIREMEPKYHSFMVRLWTKENNDNSTWFISLESTESREKLVFANLNDLLGFFENLMHAPSVPREVTEDNVSH